MFSDFIYYIIFLLFWIYFFVKIFKYVVVDLYLSHKLIDWNLFIIIMIDHPENKVNFFFLAANAYN